MSTLDPSLRSTEPDALFDEAFLRLLNGLSILSRRLARGQHRGERKTRTRGSGVEFSDHRPYAAGDDIRHVDWNILARLDLALVRQYEEDEDLPIYLITDVSASMQTQAGVKDRMARRLAAALAYIGLSKLDQVGITLSASDHHEVLPPTRGEAQVFRVLQFLRTKTQGGPTDLESVARRFCAQHPRPGLVVMLSDMYDLDGATRALAQIRHQRHQVTCIQIVDEHEYVPAKMSARGDLALIDVERHTRAELTVSDDLLRSFHEAHEAFCGDIARACGRAGSPYVRVDARADIFDCVMQIFRAGGFLR